MTCHGKGCVVDSDLSWEGCIMGNDLSWEGLCCRQWLVVGSVHHGQWLAVGRVVSWTVTCCGKGCVVDSDLPCEGLCHGQWLVVGRVVSWTDIRLFSANNGQHVALGLQSALSVSGLTVVLSCCRTFRPTWSKWFKFCRGLRINQQVSEQLGVLCPVNQYGCITVSQQSEWDIAKHYWVHDVCACAEKHQLWTRKTFAYACMCVFVCNPYLIKEGGHQKCAFSLSCIIKMMMWC